MHVRIATTARRLAVEKTRTASDPDHTIRQKPIHDKIQKALSLMAAPSASSPGLGSPSCDVKPKKRKTHESKAKTTAVLAPKIRRIELLSNPLSFCRFSTRSAMGRKRT